MICGKFCLNHDLYDFRISMIKKFLAKYFASHKLEIFNFYFTNKLFLAKPAENAKLRSYICIPELSIVKLNDIMRKNNMIFKIVITTPLRKML
jgi:hypothetical protein